MADRWPRTKSRCAGAKPFHRDEAAGQGHVDPPEPGGSRLHRQIRAVEARRNILHRLLRRMGAFLRRLCALLGGLRLLLRLRYLALQCLQLLLQRIDLPLHLIGLGILREGRHCHEDRRENCAGQQQPGALFNDQAPQADSRRQRLTFPQAKRRRNARRYCLSRFLSPCVVGKGRHCQTGRFLAVLLPSEPRGNKNGQKNN
jgi:hypothetical protein